MCNSLNLFAEAAIFDKGGPAKQARLNLFVFKISTLQTWKKKDFECLRYET